MNTILSLMELLNCRPIDRHAPKRRVGIRYRKSAILYTLVIFTLRLPKRAELYHRLPLTGDKLTA